MPLNPGTEIKVRDRYAPSKARASATVIEDRGAEGVLCYVHHKMARGGAWDSRKQLVSRDRLII